MRLAMPEPMITMESPLFSANAFGAAWISFSPPNSRPQTTRKKCTFFMNQNGLPCGNQTLLESRKYKSDVVEQVLPERGKLLLAPNLRCSAENVQAQLITHSVTVRVFHPGEGVVDDGLPGDFSEGAVEGTARKFLIATEGDVALDQLG